MKIIVDAMGGDNAPEAPVEASVDAVKELDVEIVLVGDEQRLKNELSKYEYLNEKITIVHSDDVISNYDEPAKAVRTRKTASVVIAANMLKNGEGDAMLSMGSTGALLSAALLIVGRIKGISRPALATALPTQVDNSPVLLMDAGANTTCKPENLYQFAVMGDIYMKNVLGKNSPKIGLINNGEEESKGNDLTKAAYSMLKNGPFNFIGNVEGRDINSGSVDVAVCDGFVGNVVLKTVEGMGLAIYAIVKEIFMKNIVTKFAAMLVKGGLKKFKKTMDYSEYGGAPFLGVKQPVIKGHGSSNARAVFSAIRQAKTFVETNVIADIQNSVLEVKTDD